MGMHASPPPTQGRRGTPASLNRSRMLLGTRQSSAGKLRVSSARYRGLIDCVVFRTQECVQQDE